MLYMTTSDGSKLIILETANLEELKKGRPAHTPDKSVLIAWTPDPVWLADKIMDTDGDAGKIAELIDQAAKRPQRGPRKYHAPHEHAFDHQSETLPKPDWRIGLNAKPKLRNHPLFNCAHNCVVIGT